jgi:hypothetical protein
MPQLLKGSCQCGAVSFELQSHTPAPYQRCYCSICRKTGGGSGYAVNLSGLADSLNVQGQASIGVYNAKMPGGTFSNAKRHFCKCCGNELWLFDTRWPELIHPLASIIDSDLPKPPCLVHLMLEFKPAWVTAEIAPDDQVFQGYPEKSIEDWHKDQGLWVD